MRTRTLLAALTVVVLAAGCGGGQQKSREDVAKYIVHLNTIQVGLKAPSATIVSASRRLAEPDADRASLEAQFRKAARQIDTARERLAAVPAPVEARKLRSLLLELARRQAALSNELADLAAFLPAFEKALRPLAPAGRKLEKALATKGTFESKAAAFTAYRQTLATVLTRLRGIHAPPVSRPSYTSEINAVAQTHARAGAIAKALRAKRVAQLTPLLRRFDEATLSTQSLAAQRARISAVRAYNARVRGLDVLVTRIGAERDRLQRTLR